jgi:hypothetical protein
MIRLTFNWWLQGQRSEADLEVLVRWSTESGRWRGFFVTGQWIRKERRKGVASLRRVAANSRATSVMKICIASL